MEGELTNDITILHDRLFIVSRHQKLESSTLPETTRIQYRRLSLKLAIEYHVFPSSLILLGVQCDQLTQNEEGGFADVFCGTYRGKKVAVKRVRVFATYSEPERRKLKRVRLCPNITSFCADTVLPSVDIPRVFVVERAQA